MNSSLKLYFVYEIREFSIFEVLGD